MFIVFIILNRRRHLGSSSWSGRPPDRVVRSARSGTVPKRPKSAPGLSGPRNGPNRTLFKRKSIRKNRRPETSKFGSPNRSISEVVILRVLLYVCGETAINLFAKVVCVYLSYARTDQNFNKNDFFFFLELSIKLRWRSKF